MARLTNGTFKYTRRVKPGDPNEYNAPFKEASAEISRLDDEENDVAQTLVMINNARDMATEHVNHMLGAKKAEPVAEVAEVTTQEPGKSRRGRPPKDKTPQVNDIVDETIRWYKIEPVPDDDLLGDVTAPSIEPVSTADLLSAITRKNSERMARPEEEGPDRRTPQAIRDLIGQYVQMPQTSRDIPPELRHKFLEELGKL